MDQLDIILEKLGEIQLDMSTLQADNIQIQTKLNTHTDILDIHTNMLNSLTNDVKAISIAVLEHESILKVK